MKYYIFRELEGVRLWRILVESTEVAEKLVVVATVHPDHLERALELVQRANLGAGLAMPTDLYQEIEVRLQALEGVNAPAE